MDLAVSSLEEFPGAKFFQAALAGERSSVQQIEDILDGPRAIHLLSNRQNARAGQTSGQELDSHLRFASAEAALAWSCCGSDPRPPRWQTVCRKS